MEQKKKYMFLLFSEKNGEYEYYHRKVLELPDAKSTTMNKFADKYINEFYGKESIKEDGGYSFYGGEIFLSMESCQIISQEEYIVLCRYL